MHLPDPQGIPTEALLRTALGPRAARRLAEKGVTLRDLGRRGVAELTATYGLTTAAAQKAVALTELARRHATVPMERGTAFRSSSQVFDAFHQRLRDLDVEQFIVVLLDGKHRVVKEVLVSQGTLTSSPVHPREVFGPAIRHAAAAVVLVHNHPSGDPAPSCDDLEITRRLTEVGEMVGIRVLDHVIVRRRRVRFASAWKASACPTTRSANSPGSVRVPLSQLEWLEPETHARFVNPCPARGRRFDPGLVDGQCLCPARSGRVCGS